LAFSSLDQTDLKGCDETKRRLDLLVTSNLQQSKATPDNTQEENNRTKQKQNIQKKKKKKLACDGECCVQNNC